MQRLFLSLLICLGFALPATAHAWWQDDWHYRKQISVDTTPQGAAINDPGPHRAAGAPAHRQLHLRRGQGRRRDLRFVAADDKTVLNHQIESFDPLMGMALIWVDVPNVEGGQRQDLWMYYGNQKAAATANGQLTFDPNYTALYHFDGATGTPARDTTAYGNTALNATGAASTV
jgi:biopolymer transport protein ExbB